MSIRLTPSESSSRPVRPLVERVQERVAAAAASLATSRRGDRHRKLPTDFRGSANPTDMQALRRVFVDMGRDQRIARHQTGQAPSPVVRQAALAFRQAPSLSALVLVAASLDEIGLLSW
jgi:hypothetical protein